VQHTVVSFSECFSVPETLASSDTEDEVFEIRYVITNKFGRDLVLKDPVVSCGCTAASISAKAIPAGDSAVLRVTYDREKSLYSKATVSVVGVVGEVGIAHTLEIEPFDVDGDLANRIKFSPDVIVIRNIALGGSSSHLVTVRLPPGDCEYLIENAVFSDEGVSVRVSRYMTEQSDRIQSLIRRQPDALLAKSSNNVLKITLALSPGTASFDKQEMGFVIIPSSNELCREIRIPAMFR